MVERVVIVDEEDKVIGAKTREELYKNPQWIHRSSNLLLFNSKGELLLQKRSKSKKWFPGLYDYSVSGVVNENESYLDCISRELQEEFSLNTKISQAIYFRHDGQLGKSYKVIFTACSDQTFKIDQEEIESVRWISLDKLKEEIEQHPETFTPQFVIGMRLYFASCKT